MLLFEIFEKSETNLKKSSGYMAARAARAAVPGAKKLGGGAFGAAFSEPGDIERVVKVAKLQDNRWSQDGYVAYIQAIQDMKSQAEMNPYLPQIYDIKKFKPEQRNKIPYLEVTMEKLYSIKSLSPDEAKTVLEKITTEQLHDYGPEWRVHWKPMLVEILNLAMRRSGRNAVTFNRKRWNFADEHFIEAINLVRKLKNRYNLDIHEGNIMFRRTSTGVQLVITDPLSWRKFGK